MKARIVFASCIVLLALWPVPGRAAEPSDEPADSPRTEVDIDGQPVWGQMLATAWEVLQQAHVSFEGVSGTVKGFYPGSAYYYPDRSVPFYLYARDTATIVPAAQYFYDDATLRTPIEEFLRLQYGPAGRGVDGRGTSADAGAISATISPALQVDKATVVSDEETSLIRAAYRYYRAAGGAPWLARDLKGLSVIERLNQAMEWLLRSRLDPELGVIIRGHTTDWGDIKQEGGAAPTDLSPTDALTYSIYDQALAFSSLMELSEMNLAAGRPALASRYYDQAQRLRQRANELLWMPERGYYRLHGHVSPDLQHAFDEDEIVSIGNAAALYYGLASQDQAMRIVEVLEQARLAAGAPKPGLTLQPAYPDGVFANAQMGARVYQNGAIWDWWGGRQIMGEFLYGHARLASEHLALVAHDWAAHPGKVYEWESPWLGRTSDDYRYAGAAAVMAEALIEGLFGVSIADGMVRVQPRLAERSGSIRAYHPASGLFVAYRYDFRAPGSVIELRLATNSQAPVPVSVLLPDAVSPWQVTVDGAAVTGRLELVGRDAYLTIEVQPGERTVILRRVPAGQSSSLAL